MATEKVYDYFLNTHNRNSYNKTGGALLNYVHFNLVVAGYPNNVNAFWDGSKMTYGDGGGSYGPVVSLDVVAHEIGHGILQYSGGLDYKGESGALNEGFSDIWAACVEAQVTPTKQKWKIGEDISVFGIPFRSISNPNDYNQPDTYHGTNWANTNCGNPSSTNDYCGVHTNSGVLNYWFYLLTDGGSGTNDINNAFSVTGIGINDAEKIAYRTINSTMASNFNATFADARTQTIQAAIDLFGSTSCQVISVTNAWYAVGANYQSPLTISGPASLCSSGNFSVNGLPAGATVAWSVSGPIAISGSTTGNTVTIVQNGNGSGIITASITLTCGSAVVINKTIDAGIPMPSYISILQQSCLGGSDWEVTFQAVPAITNGQYIWVYNGVDMPATTSSSFYTYASLATSVNINLKIKNACGTSANLYSSDATFYSPCNGSRFAVFPNPANDELKIEKTGDKNNGSTSKANEHSNDEFTVKFFDNKGKVLRSVSNNDTDGRIILSTKDLSNGTYFLHITEGQETIKKQIIVQH